MNMKKSIIFRVEPSLHAAYMRLAQARNVNLSTLIRTLLDAEIEFAKLSDLKKGGRRGKKQTTKRG
jgi:hypothetical protein